MRNSPSYPLTQMQQGMLFNYLNAAVPGQDVEQILCSLEAGLSAELLEQAWTQLLARHSGLRVSFNWWDAELPTQTVRKTLAPEFQQLDWQAYSADEAEQKLEKLLWNDRKRGFDLEHDPCLRFALVRMPQGHYQFLWSFHHIILDGRSFGLLLSEAFAIYAKLLNNSETELAPAIPFQDFVSWQRELDHAESLPFWRELLAGVSEPTILKFPDVASDQTQRGFGVEKLRLSAELTLELRALARRYEVGLPTVLQAAWSLLLARYSGSNDVVFGVTRACRGGPGRETGSAPGIFINTLPARVLVDADATVADWFAAIRDQQHAVSEHEHTPLVDVQRCSELPAGQGLLDSIVVYDQSSLNEEMRALGDDWQQRSFELLERPSFPLALYAYGDSELLLRLTFEQTRADASDARRLLAYLETALGSMCDSTTHVVSDIAYLPVEEIDDLHQLGLGTALQIPERFVHELCTAHAEAMPDDIAVVAADRELTWRQLDERANAVAARLIELGAGPEKVIGLCTDRSGDLAVALFGIFKTGAAYLPLDPDFPADRLEFMIEDSGTEIIVTQSALRNCLGDNDATCLLLDHIEDAQLDSFAAVAVTSDRLAYLIYTSGSTGKPKGVMVEHGNLNNFLVGMDEVVDHQDIGAWLAVTSLSFDISALELIWTLSRGYRVVMFSGESVNASTYDDVELDFGLFYFAAGGEQPNAENRYRLLLEGAKFADQHQFNSVWTPERHFHDFGGLYPNPVVAAAALATITSQIDIRAGSVVLPLHDPLRVAEDWALVDNLSNGRVGISVASGWHPNDFALAPANYADRKQVMIESLEQVRRLWRGEEVEVINGIGQKVSVGTLPRPVQEYLPVWVTTSGNIDTYREAGRQGANVLTHLLGQSVEEVADKVAAYRQSYRDSGAPGRGHVTLMLHTFVGEDTDAIRELVRQPMVEYLRSSASLVKNFVSSWTAYRGNAGTPVQADGDEFSKLSKEDMDDLLNYSFELYFETSGLFGSEQRCMEMLQAVYAADIDEVACLIDFGVADNLVLEQLNELNAVRQQCLRKKHAHVGEDNYRPTIADLIARYDVTHMQCTPSMARMLMAEPIAKAAIEKLDTLLIGGEAFPRDLAAQLAELPDLHVTNMYGPTETTIWSATFDVNDAGPDFENSVPIGRPIVNTELQVLDEGGQLLPRGVPGELYIGGAGVARGYFKRPELTAERFVSRLGGRIANGRLYRTGDVVRWRDDDALEFLGRTDFQVKIRGHRIELGEIEFCLMRHPQIVDCVVASRTAASGTDMLVAWVVASGVSRPDVDSILAHLGSHLPEYMLPSSIVYLDALPLTPNRKVDRKALPGPGLMRPELAASYVPPQTELEEILADIWKDLLRVDRVGRLDNYFKLGGHSLIAVQLAFRIRDQLGIEVPMRAFFTNPTLKSMASALENFLLEGVDDDELVQAMSDGEIG